MTKAILDTNIYGKMVELGHSGLVLSKQDTIRVYGSELIRQELRRISSEQTIQYEDKIRKIRIVLLSIYDSLVGDRNLSLTPAIGALAEQYYELYKRLEGKEKHEQIINDFIIVATATIHTLEVVYSDDEKTMCSKRALFISLLRRGV
ncbi:type II toxin-antitoxin system VapC family toxin [Candidatus Woesearchaeota archaeon]|nr:type II toxin-antitoxin system VapC family toxin [Candidatus Woesearchaeota archaeon]